MILPILIGAGEGKAPTPFARQIAQLLPPFDPEAWDTYCSEAMLKALRGRNSVTALIDVAHKSPREPDVTFALLSLEQLVPRADLTRQESLKLRQVLRDIGELPPNKWPDAQSAARSIRHLA